ncbi:MAG: AraC family transcriptional regulator [Firmicutes bacterium]|nr:AraC family transcriptional regulator [Bacillota bacterium]
MYRPYIAPPEFEITAFYSAFERHCTDDYVYAGEFHDFWEFAFVIDGSIQVAADENIIHLSKNQIIFHKPMEFHRLRAETGSEPVLFIVSFQASGDFMNFFANKVIQLTPQQVSEIMDILHFLKKITPSNFPGSMVTASLKVCVNHPHWMQKFKNLVENFLISLSESDAELPELISNPETTIYKNAVTALEEYIYSQITIDELAQLCNVSTAYLKRIFSKYTDLGIHEYFIKTKINLAKRLLSEGLSVTEVSEKLSFSSQSYFSVVFKREEGMTPSQFRQIHGL